MANIVRVDLGAARKGVSDFDGRLNELNIMIRNMNARVEQTKDMWQGDAANAYRASFDRACKFFTDTLTKKLQDHGQRMLKSVETQHTQDTNIAGQIVRY